MQGATLQTEIAVGDFRSFEGTMRYFKVVDYSPGSELASCVEVNRRYRRQQIPTASLNPLFSELDLEDLQARFIETVRLETELSSEVLEDVLDWLSDPWPLWGRIPAQVLPVVTRVMEPFSGFFTGEQKDFLFYCVSGPWS